METDLQKLHDAVAADLKKGLISSSLLLHNFRFIEESSRQTAAYMDPKYVPFYYYLGKYITPKFLLEIGFRLGLFSGCFLRSCKSVENVLVFQEKTNIFYSHRLGARNVKDHYKGALRVHIGTVYDEKFDAEFHKNQWDLVIINEETTYDKHLEYMDKAWAGLSLGGLIVMDYINFHEPAKKCFLDFCKMKNRDFISFRTRYGTNIMQR